MLRHVNEIFEINTIFFFRMWSFLMMSLLTALFLSLLFNNLTLSILILLRFFRAWLLLKCVSLICVKSILALYVINSSTILCLSEWFSFIWRLFRDVSFARDAVEIYHWWQLSSAYVVDEIRRQCERSLQKSVACRWCRFLTFELRVQCKFRWSSRLDNTSVKLTCAAWYWKVLSFLLFSSLLLSRSRMNRINRS